MGGSSIAGTATASGLVRRQVVGAADREVDPDHPPFQGNPRISRCRAGVIAVAHPGPADAALRRLLDRGLGSAGDDKMSQPVVAVDQRHRRLLAGDADIRLRVDPAGADAPDILRQPEDPVAVGAVQVRFDDQRCAGRCVPWRQAHRLQGPRRKPGQPVVGNTMNAVLLFCHELAPGYAR
jgi:hypothetical protein